MTQYIGRVFDDRSRFAADYTSPVRETRAEAAADCFAARPDATRCMVSEARFSESMNDIVATHYGVRWVKRPPATKRASFLSRIFRLPPQAVNGKA